MFNQHRLVTLTAFMALMPCLHSCADQNTSQKAPPTQKEDAPKKDTKPPAPSSSPTASESAENGDIDVAQLSEAFGNFIGRNLTNPGAEFNIDALVVGIRNGADGKPSPLTEDEYEEMMTAFQERAFNALADNNLNEANAFMEKNKSEAGVKEVEPGKLQIQTLEEGEGEPISEDNHIKISYTGKYIDGTVFGSSEETGGSVTLSPKQTIPGFRQGIEGMKKGEKRKLFVHPDLGYGTTGQLPPNQLLIFEIELLDPQAEEPEYSLPGMMGDDDDDDFDFDDDDDEDFDDDEDEEGENGGNSGIAMELDEEEEFDVLPLNGRNDPNQQIGEDDENIGDVERTFSNEGI